MCAINGGTTAHSLDNRGYIYLGRVLDARAWLVPGSPCGATVAATFDIREILLPASVGPLHNHYGIPRGTSFSSNVLFL